MQTRAVLRAASLVLVTLFLVAEAHAEDEPAPEPNPSRELLPPEAFGRSGNLRRRFRAPEGVPLPGMYSARDTGEPALWAPGVGIMGGGVLLSYLGAGLGYAFSGEGGFCFGISLPCSGGTGIKNDAYLYGFLPLVGPFVVAADDRVDTDGRIAFAAFGVAQTLGLGLTIAGAVWRHEVWTLKPSAASRVTLTPGGLSAALAF